MSFRREDNGRLHTVANALRELDGVEAKTGWFETAHYEDGTPVAYVATIQEFGAPKAGIPPRPSMRPAVAQYAPKWLDAMQHGAKAVVNGQMTASDALERVALLAAGHVRKKIREVETPALKPATIAARRANKSGARSEKPLVETGQMIQSVTGKVERSTS